MTTIVTRSGKGSALTYEELDSNFTNLNTDKLETAGGTVTGNIQITGTNHGIIFPDGSVQTTSGSQDLSEYTTHTELQANISTVTTAWTANAASQQTAINTANTNITNLQSNAASQQTTINTHTTDITNLWANAAAQSTEIAGKTTTAYVDSAVSTAVNNLINSAPGTLDTLGEIAANLATNADTVGAILNSITSTNANVSAANAKIAAIETVNSNQGTDITNLWSNAASQATTIATHTTQIGDLQSNAASQQASIDHMPTLYAYVHNAEGATISKGQPVYLYQATGDKPSVKLAYNTGDATSAKTLGLAAETLTTGAEGWVQVQGQLTGLDTSAYTEGATLYLGSTAGTLTTTKPYAPNHLVYIGVVSKANAGAGSIYIRVQNGYELDEIHDVQILSGSQANNDVLMYDSNLGLWRNKTIGNLKANLSLATVATSGSYTDLTDKPTIPGQDAAGANQIVYKNSSNVATGTSSMVYDGTSFKVSSGNIESLYSNGDEGGEFRLATAQTNTTLSGGSVAIDINQNRLRIFEVGGSNRGAYIDLTAASAGVGSNLLSGGGGSSYGNAEVATYLPVYSGSLENSSSIQNLWANAATQATSLTAKADTASLAAVATSGSYNDLSNKPSIPSSSVSIDGDATGAGTTGSNVTVTLSNSGVTAGTYGDTTVVPKLTVDSKGRITSVSNVAISSSGGSLPAGGTQFQILTKNSSTDGDASWTNGSIDGIQYFGDSTYGAIVPTGYGRIRFRAYPTSDFPTGITPVLNSSSLMTAPTYNASNVVTNSGPAVAAFQSNLAIQSAYGVGGNKSYHGIYNAVSVTPVTANTMASTDRVRGLTTFLDVHAAGKTWGSMSSSGSAGNFMAGTVSGVNFVGNGSTGQLQGVASLTFASPNIGSANVQYQTTFNGTLGYQTTGSSISPSLITYARLVAGTIAGLTANTAVSNAVGLHTVNGWAGTGTTQATNKYAVLNEDANTAIQTNGITTLNGNVTIGSRTILTYSSRNASTATTYDLHSFAGSFLDYSLDSNLTLQLNASPAPNTQKIEGRFVQDATGGRTVTWPAGSKTSGSINTAANAITMFTCYVINGAAHVIYTQVS